MDIYASDAEKSEEIKRWWRDNGRSVIAGVIIGIAVVVSWRYWFSYQQNQSENAATLYQQVVMAASESEFGELESLTQELMQDYGGTPYAVFATFEMASLAAQSDTETAIEYLQWARENADLSAQEAVARLRLARLYLDEGEHDTALELVGSEPPVGFKSLYHELQGDIHLEMGDKMAAGQAYEMALSSAEPEGGRRAFLQMKLDDVAVQDES